MGVSKLPRGRYVVTSVLGNNKATIEGKDIKDPVTRLRFQQYATPYVPPKPSAESNVSAKSDRSSYTSDTVSAKGYRGLSAAKAPTQPPQTLSPARKGQTTQMDSTPSKPLSKASTTPPAYNPPKTEATATKRGAVTSYQSNGYTYQMTSQGTAQNFEAGDLSRDKRKGGR